MTWSSGGLKDLGPKRGTTQGREDSTYRQRLERTPVGFQPPCDPPCLVAWKTGLPCGLWTYLASRHHCTSQFLVRNLNLIDLYDSAPLKQLRVPNSESEFNLRNGTNRRHMYILMAVLQGTGLHDCKGWLSSHHGQAGSWDPGERRAIVGPVTIWRPGQGRFKPFSKGLPTDEVGST